MEIKDALTIEQFQEIYRVLGVKETLDLAFLYEAYQNAIEGAQGIAEANLLGKVVPINPISLILYLVNEHGYFLDVHPQQKQDEIINDDKYMQQLVSVALDKYYANEHLAFKAKTVLSRFSPSISTLNTYLNFVLGILSRFNRNQPNETLLIDIMSKGFSMAKAITDLLVNGFETEAFSTWRTLHEVECILLVLNKHGKPLIDKYLMHMNYAMAFRGVTFSKERIDELFVIIKEEMHLHNLKSKDMKRFIEYGWLLAIPDVEKGTTLKLNFRDGVELLAGLKRYSPIYEISSEIAHSSPLLIYSRRDYFMHMTLLNLYESFFRLEKIFYDVYIKTINKSEHERFMIMRQIYYEQLVSLHQQEQNEIGKYVAEKKKKGQ